MSHTPGPWTVVLTGKRGSFYISEAHKDEAAHADDGFDGYSVSKANAHLIAAAPDLLAACKALRAEVQSHNDDYYHVTSKERLSSVDAVIAKAEGR